MHRAPDSRAAVGLGEQSMTPLPGASYPLGATWDGAGVNFALFSGNATGVELCLFDGADGNTEVDRADRADLPGLACLPAGAAARPALRLSRARAVRAGARPAIQPGQHAETDLSLDERDSAPLVPKSVVIDPAFDWGDDRPLRTPWHDSVLYEIHIKGFTARHPDVPSELRGSYAGMAHPAVTGYLRDLGVTAVELLPIQQHVDERSLVERGLTNYWGYNPIGYFAPDLRYASTTALGGQVGEFKAMVKALHAAGIEVILDVVYNHTAEGNQLGPTLAFRGLDNAAYYRLRAGDPRYYEDFSGCGNMLDMRQLQDLRLAVFLNGRAIPGMDRRGEPVVDDSFYLLLNAHEAAVDFTLPPPAWGERWSCVLDTVEPRREHGDRWFTAGETVTVEGRSLVLLRREDRATGVGQPRARVA